VKRGFTPCPDFDLSPLDFYPPEIFQFSKVDQQTKQISDFFLTLSVIFNDLKGLSWMSERLACGRPLKFELSPYCGQHLGMELQILKYTMSLIFELSEFISKNKAMNKPGMKKYLGGKLPQRAQKGWDDLLKFSEGKRVDGSEAKKFYGILKSVRDKAVFHYSHKLELVEGYNNHFNKSGEEYDYAYASIGKTMEKTRFYFADATVQGFILEEIEKRGLSWTKFSNDFMKEHARAINQALRFVIEHFLIVRGKELGEVG